MSPTRRSAEAPLTDGDFRSLAEFRHALREFLAFSEEAARGAGITPHHHQLLLAVRGYPGPAQPSMSDIAEWLHLKLHSAGELVARAEAAGLVERVADPSDARRVLLAVSTAGQEKLDDLTRAHRVELRQFRDRLSDLLDGV